MDLSKLKWVKNVRPDKGKGWAHKEVSTEIHFRLGWRYGNKENVEKPCEGELILLKQKAKVTHIVKLLDDKVDDDGDPNGWRYRFVRPVWIPPSSIKNWDTLPHQKELFGFDIKIQGGKAHNLEEEGKMAKFHERWDTEGGLKAFQKFLAKKLSDISPIVL